MRSPATSHQPNRDGIDGSVLVPSRPQWQPATVESIRTVTPLVASIVLRPEVAVGYRPGQYCNIRVHVAGRQRPIQRAYSIASSPTEEDLEVLVGRIESGLVSPVLHRLAPGDTVELRYPHGDFGELWPHDGPVCMVGGGTGVAPLLSMLRHASATGTNTPVTLVVSSRSWHYVVGWNELSELSTRHDWLTVVHTFTRDRVDPRAAFHRRVDAAMLTAVGASTALQVYVSGWPEMVEATQLALATLGIDPARIRTEKYT